MSRNFLILVVILVFACYGASLLYFGPAQQPEQLNPEQDFAKEPILSLSFISEEIHAQNKTVLIEKIEQLAEDNYSNLVAIGYVDPLPYLREGTVVTVTYPASIELIWIAEEYIHDTRVEKSVRFG